MSEAIAVAPRTRHSPCVGICKLDERTGYCIGCARSGDEIGRWSGMTEAQRDSVWELLPARHDRLAIRMRLLPWTMEELAQWVVTTMESRAGTWVTGVPGAFAEFPCAAGRDLSIARTEQEIVAGSEDGSFRLTLHDKTRAFEFGQGGPVVLGLPKARGTLGASRAFRNLGEDLSAVRGDERGHALFDMGLGRTASRFCFRSGDPDLIGKLTALDGQSWPDVMRQEGMAILSAHPHRVVESKLARIEAYGPIPPPGGEAPDGVRTVFLPPQLQDGEEGQANLTLPEYALPIAIFYPSGGCS